MAEITNKLLKQAIADAEAVRETAVANAKLVLEEAIAPQIKDMIARRLRVEAEMQHAQEEMGDTPPMKKEASATLETAKEEPFEDGEAVGSSEMPADSSTVGTGDNKEPSADAFDTSAVGDGGENVEDSHTDWYDDWSESDFDLNEIIAELEADIAALAEGGKEGDEDEDKEVMDEVSHETEDSDVQKFAKAPVTEEETEEEGEAEKGGMEKTAHIEKSMEKGTEDKGDEEEISLEAILAELEADDAEEESPAMGAPAKDDVAAKLAHIKNELAQYREAVNILRGRLQEVNLLNAKLLFTNKLFKKEGLNNDQKIRIVESFDRATTVREVKLVYTALVENLSVAAKTFAASRKKVVAEGLASKATRTTAPKSEVIVENTVAKRLQQLAGII